MKRSISVLYIQGSTLEMTSLMDRELPSAFLTEEIKGIIHTKIHHSNFENFNLQVENYTYEVTIETTPSLDFICIFTPLIHRIAESSVELEITLKDQQTKLFELAKSRKITKETLVGSLQSVSETISHLIGCERIGIWLFDDEHKILTAQNVYDKRFSLHKSGDLLHLQDFPTYFHSVKESRALAVHDVSQDSRVSELYPGYFDSVGGIKSILDAPILLSSGIGGVLCCESRTKRVWSELDQTLVGTLADMVAFLFERVFRLEAEEQVRDLAYVDQLTGLSNHNAFILKANEELKTVSEFSFVYLKLDQFNTIQDVLGIEGGEEVLKLTANRLRAHFPDPSIVARIGFDHFALFFNKKNNSEFQQQLLELTKPMMIEGQEVYITYSYGISAFPEHGSSAKICLQRAQIALNDGRKFLSRGVNAVFTPDMIEVSKSDLQVEMNLRKGLDLEEFTLFYQPQINCNTSKVEGFEALIRWNHPERGLVSPIEFISLAESTGLILPIGEWVIRQAFEQLQTWKEQGNGHFSLSINISPRHFLHERLVQMLNICLEDYNISPDKLMIEITENVAMGDYVAVQNRIKELRQLGFGVSIDDFGTGFSAFVYLQHFPIQEIKIDRRFIREILDNPKSLGIVKTIVELAKYLNLRVVTEGVETDEQLNLLREIGCETIQGYYYSKPLPIEEIDVWLAQYV
ncbi:MAG: EAL domain-containing protein [Paenisporosarcina sp.]